MSRNQIMTWIKASSNIKDDPRNCICPQCSHSGLRIQYIGDLDTRVGYALVWCDNCLHGIHISRTLIPADVHALPFSVSAEEMAHYVPAFKLIS